MNHIVSQFSPLFDVKQFHFVSRMPRIFNCFYSDLIYSAPQFQWVFDFFARLFTVINSSINFFIYSMPGSDFRRGIDSFLGIGDSSQTYQQTISLNQVNSGNFPIFLIDKLSPTPSFSGTRLD